jgi:pyrroline-5-carboxylate reductase
VRIACIGGGNMARAIIGGLIAKGLQPAEILVVDVDVIARSKIAAQFGVEVAGSMEKIAHADVILFAVKPQQMQEAAAAVALHAGEALFITIAAGIRLADLARWLGGRSRLIRAMPNTPALVHAGVTGLHAGPGVADIDRTAAEVLLGAVGAVVWFERESDLDVVTAVSGSGPAYVFYAIEALERAARELGLADGAARTLALWTFVGATKLAIEKGEDPAQLRAQVTSKGGTTEAAIRVLDERGVRESYLAAVRAACDRSRELGDALGKGTP